MAVPDTDRWVDDATGTIPHALFREQEDAHYFLLLERIIRDKGTPLAAVQCSDGIFQRSPADTESPGG